MPTDNKTDTDTETDTKTEAETEAEQPNEPASPVCYANEVDPAYMGLEPAEPDEDND
ncbi:MAG TPA: hypothetical protein VJ998_11810 [Pseudomonadales bacterium]|nr:hypothetical protein [Pseudomonadales bacterium]